MLLHGAGYSLRSRLRSGSDDVEVEQVATSGVELVEKDPSLKVTYPGKEDSGFTRTFSGPSRRPRRRAGRHNMSS